MARVRGRQPVEPSPGVFDRSKAEWIALGQVSVFDEGEALPPLSLRDRIAVLVERSALRPAEVTLLRDVADGAVELEGLPEAVAAMHAARWDGPIDGVRLTPLQHWKDNNDG